MDYIKDTGKAYRVKFSYTIQGKRKYYSKSFAFKDFRSKQDALRSAKTHLFEAKAKYLDSSTANNETTLREVFLLKCRDYPRTVSTVKKEESIMRTHVYPYIAEDRAFNSIRVPEIQATLNNMIQTERDDTITRLRHIWNILYMTAEVEGIVEQNLMGKVRTPKSEVIETHRNQDTNKETLDIMVEYLLKDKHSKRTNFNDKMIAYSLLAMYYLGIRPSEAYAISTDCIDFANNRILINKAIGSTITESGTEKKTKTKKSTRLLPIPLDFKPYLEEMSYRDHPFYDYNNDPLETSVVSCRICNISKRLGLDFHAYQLRHRFITDLWESSADKNTIQQTVGHANESMSLSYGVRDQLKVDEAVNRIRATEMPRKCHGKANSYQQLRTVTNICT